MACTWRANTANPFQHVQVLDPGAVFGAFFDAAVDKTQADGGAGDDLAVHGEFKMAGFF